MRFGDTIFAVASGAGRAALTVLRLSGPGCGGVLQSLCRDLPPPRRASLRSLRDGEGALLDRALVLWLPGPGSYTGEDCAELHLHGGAAVQEGVITELSHLGARPAEAGEFTRRSVTHGRMDLLEAEAIADLIDAETTLQRDQALRQMGGALTSIYAGWADRLLRLLAQQEALIDFPDENLPASVETAMLAEISTLHAAFSEHLTEGSRGERLRSGLVFAIAGAPNAGKSTLINALCHREVAIVSPRAGTTRDVLEARIELAGVPVTLLDTAGLRETDDEIEIEGVRRARDRLATADLVIALRAPDESAPGPSLSTGAPPAGPVLEVLTKRDQMMQPPVDTLSVSALTGDGMPSLLAALEDHARRLAGLAQTPVLTRARHRAALSEAADHLTASLQAPWPELRGEELRLAVLALGRITGAVGVEDVLDSVFRQFCIGK